jgi:hypothetical protein
MCEAHIEKEHHALRWTPENVRDTFQAFEW